MKYVTCRNTIGVANEYLTIDKSYEIDTDDDIFGGIRIECDDGFFRWFNYYNKHIHNNFYSQQEQRNIRLNEILQ
jgi:hypothetical protein